MKILRIGFCFISVLFLLSCKIEGNSFIIDGHIQNPEKECIYVLYPHADSFIRMDTVLLSKNGQFRIGGQADSLGLLILMASWNNWCPVFVDKGYKVSFRSQTPYLSLADIEGGKMNRNLDAFRKKIRSTLEEKYWIEKAIWDIYKGENNDFNLTILEELRPTIANLNHSLGVQVEQYVKEHPASMESVALMFNVLCKNDLFLRLQSALPLLKDPAKSFYITDYLFQLSENIQQVDVKKQAPDFTLPDIQNRPVSLSDFRGQYVLLHFWASDDPFSRIVNKYYLRPIYCWSEAEGRQLSLLGVCLDGDINSWKQTIIQDEIDWTTVSDLEGINSDVLTRYGIFSSPKNFLINPDGIIIAKDIDYDDIYELIP
jgi:peroxiredoxin